MGFYKDKERYEIILDILSRYPHNRILDIGCVGVPGESDANSGNWLHGLIVSHFSGSEVIGIDIDKNAVDVLVKRGYNVKLMDAENFSFEEKFDVIVAAELIEHLANPGMFMHCCAKNLHDNGILVISTPYPFNLDYFMSSHFKEGGFTPGLGHAMWFCPKTLDELARRYGFKQIEIHYIEYDYQPSHLSLKTLVYHKCIKSFLRMLKMNSLFRGGFISVLKKV